MLDGETIEDLVDNVLLVDDVEKREDVVREVYQMEVLTGIVQAILVREVLVIVSSLVLVQNIPFTNISMDDDHSSIKVKVQVVV